MDIILRLHLQKKFFYVFTAHVNSKCFANNDILQQQQTVHYTTQFMYILTKDLNVIVIFPITFPDVAPKNHIQTV